VPNDTTPLADVIARKTADLVTLSGTRSASNLPPRSRNTRTSNPMIAACTIDLSATDLATGNADVSEDELEPADWLHYQYYQSPGLLNSLESASGPAADFATALQAEYARTVAVVSPSGIDDFLGKTSKMLENRRAFGWDDF